MTSRTIRPTVRAVDALPACSADSKSSGVEYSFLGHPGLKVLVSKSREIVFYHRFVLNGRKCVQRLGRYPDFAIEEAVQKVRENRSILDRGGDPLAAVKLAEAEPTLEQFATNELLPFFEQYKRSVKADESKIRIHFIPRWGDWNLGRFVKRDIQTYHVEVARKLSPATANRHLMLLSKMFSLAHEWKRVGVNDPSYVIPTKGVKQFRENIKPQPQLKEIDIGPLFRAMDEDPNQLLVALLKILLLTGARRSEGQSMRWADLDLQGRHWVISKTKSGKTHIVQLNDAACVVLAGIPRTGSPFVFPHRHDPSKSCVNPVKVFARVLAKCQLPHMRLHSLRHAFCSFAVGAGASLYQVQNLVGHASVSTTTRYAHVNNQVLKQATQLVSSIVSNAISEEEILA